MGKWLHFPSRPESRSGFLETRQTFERNLEDVTLHDLRRTCASYLAIANENLPTIQSVLNHRSLVQTSTYARLNTGAVDRALQAQADRLCNLMQAVDVPTALTQGEPMPSGGC